MLTMCINELYFEGVYVKIMLQLLNYNFLFLFQRSRAPKMLNCVPLIDSLADPHELIPALGSFPFSCDTQHPFYAKKMPLLSNGLHKNGD